MNEPHDPNRHDDGPSVPADSHNPGQGKPAEAPKSSLDASQPQTTQREAEGENSPIVKPQSDAIPPPDQRGDRYQLFGEIVRGAMGAVLRGRDVDLGRDLAVKVLLEKYANHPEVVRRFIEEAQIAAQLQHPGIPAVYDIGRFGERPFFTMKLVKGSNLETLLGERSDPSEDRPHLLAIVLQVAQTMAYAHAKGVIHRDLKPGNIMVGAFGEVQVMDWGLSRVLDEASQERPSPQDGTTIRTARSGSPASAGTPTEAGPLLGTPAYMPPEQARGEIARLDRRADVFGLGAILCEVLTGKPPYVGPSAEEVRRKAANGDLGEALIRLDGCGADQELIVLTKACLSPEAIDRPRDAQAVAEALTIYLDGVHHRLRQAEVARAVAEATRRLLRLALAMALVALLLGGGTFAWWRNEQAQLVRQRDARNAGAVAALLGQAEEALKAGDAAKAQVALDAAWKRSAEGGAEKEAARLERLVADLALLNDLDAVNQFRWTVIDNKIPDAAVVARRTREALRRFGADPETVADEAAARVSASAVRERIVSALDRLLRQEKTAGVRAVLRRVDADPYRDAVRDVVLANDLAKFVELAGQEAALEHPAGFVAFIGDSPVIAVERRRQLLQAAVGRRPGDLGLLMTLGASYPIDQKESADEKLRWLQAAVTAAPANPATHNNLGNALEHKGQVDEAIACFRNAIGLDPRFASAHLNLGNALHQKRDLDGAIACFRKALQLQPDLTAAKKALDAALKDKGRQGNKP
jgi:tetratricopeptide (TPR) repeat protein